MCAQVGGVAAFFELFKPGEGVQMSDPAIEVEEYGPADKTRQGVVTQAGVIAGVQEQQARQASVVQLLAVEFHQRPVGETIHDPATFEECSVAE